MIKYIEAYYLGVYLSSRHKMPLWIDESFITSGCNVCGMTKYKAILLKDFFFSKFE